MIGAATVLKKAGDRRGRRDAGEKLARAVGFAGPVERYRASRANYHRRADGSAVSDCPIGKRSGDQHRTHDRVRVFTQLQAVAREYQNSSYATVSADPAQGQRAVITARARLQSLLDEAARLPANDARERAISGLIAAQGQAVLEYYREPSALAARVNRVDRIYQTEGSVKAMREVERITQPIR